MASIHQPVNLPVVFFSLSGPAQKITGWANFPSLAT
jgi:hypothetical protein